MIEINKIYNEDCCKTMAKMPDNYFNFCLTSPPYDSLRCYGNKSTWNFSVFQKIALELIRTLKNGGVIIWNVNDATMDGSETGTSFKQALFFKDNGLRLHDTMIFAKNNPPPLNHNRYDPAFEYLFVFSKGKPKVFNPILEKCVNSGKTINRISNTKALTEKKYAIRCRGEVSKIKEYKYHKNIFYYNVGQGNTGCHTAPFPKQLAEDMIFSWTKEGDLIYDPFAGSGTTLLVAKEMNRNFIGSEIYKEYYKFIKSKI